LSNMLSDGAVEGIDKTGVVGHGSKSKDEDPEDVSLGRAHESTKSEPIEVDALARADRTQSTLRKKQTIVNSIESVPSEFSYHRLKSLSTACDFYRKKR
jgi:hypothetical protein